MKNCHSLPSRLRLSIAFAALGLGSPLAMAHTLGPAAQTESATDLQRSCRRILHLRSGAVWAGVARLKGETWQVKRQGKWIDIPARQVLRAPKEAELKAQCKRRHRNSQATQESRLELAKWCASEGLRAEALTEIDSILDLRPNDAETLHFLHEAALIAVPRLGEGGAAQSEAREVLFDYARNAPRAAREVALEELRKLEDQNGLHEVLLAGMGDQALRQRSFCANGLGRLFPGQDALRLMQHAVLDTSAEVRRAASEALGAAGQAELITPVVHALASQNPRVRLQAVEALGYMAYPAAIAPIVSFINSAAAASGDAPLHRGYIFSGTQRAYIQDFDVEVATFQAVADPQINVLLQGQVLEVAVTSSSAYSFATAGRYARTSLQRITGVDAGNTARDWVRWWNENEATYGARAMGAAD